MRRWEDKGDGREEGKLSGRVKISEKRRESSLQVEGAGANGGKWERMDKDDVLTRRGREDRHASR